ncbi:MAG: sigma 54-interacting transcriptional regulator [Deltaproteobacteria bacterium]|nr:sigma 54-interacting transcriptional regulator [Deltaproteobacteria bacterium]
MVDDSTLSVQAPAHEPAWVPVLYLALEGARPGGRSARYALADVDAVAFGRGARRTAVVERDAGRRVLVLAIPDPRMSSRHATLERELGRWILADAGSKNGTLVDGERIAERVALDDGARVEMGHTLFALRRHCLPPGAPAILDAADVDALPGMLTIDPDLAAVFERLRAVAAASVPVLVGGETGTGKELLARAVHVLSGRRGELVAVNCAAIPAGLVEAELFGVRRGAYSGALEDRPGLVRRADGGTLFLDEVGDLAPPAQAALLRVLQEREVVAVGDTRPVAVDFRVVAATLHDLDARVAAGAFRADLLARLAGFCIALPPLRDRSCDLGILVAAILRARAPERAERMQLSLEAMRALTRHDWPGNIRELDRCLEAALALTPDLAIDAAHLPQAIRAPAAESGLTPDQQAHRGELIALLVRHRGNLSAAARELGKARMQLHRWLTRYGIDPERFRRA